MTQNKVSDCHGAEIVGTTKKLGRHLKDSSHTFCSSCFQPCSPVEAKVGPQGDSSGITPIQEAAGKVSKHFGRAIERLGVEAKTECCEECITPASGAPDETVMECSNPKCRYCHNHSPKPPEDREFVGEGTYQCYYCGGDTPHYHRTKEEEQGERNCYICANVEPTWPQPSARGIFFVCPFHNGNGIRKSYRPWIEREGNWMGVDYVKAEETPAPRPTEGSWEDRFAKTKFAKGGGSSFECSDYEGMYADLKSFIAAELAKAREEGKQEKIKEMHEFVIPAVKSQALTPYRAELREKIRKTRDEIKHTDGCEANSWKKEIAICICTALEQKEVANSILSLLAEPNNEKK